MVSNERTHSRFSFRVRMNRSAQPLPSGARTKAGELSIPRKRSSFRKASAMYCDSWSATRGLRPVVVPDGEATGDVLGEATEVATHTLAQRLEGFRAVRAPGGMGADALGAALADGVEHRRLALAGDGSGQVGAPHDVHRV